MPTLQVQLSDVKQRRRPDGQLTDNVLFTATDSQNRQFSGEIDISDIDTWNNFVDWLLYQQPEFVLLPEKEKLIEFTFHVDEDGNRVRDDNVTIIS